MTALADALHLAGLGFEVFPVNAEKRPACPNGHLRATSDRDKVANLFERYPGDLVGVRPPEDTLFLDLDLYKDEGLVATMDGKGWNRPRPAFFQKTRGGGEHLPYLTDGRYVANTSDWGGVEALDTRTHNGYVVAWEPGEWAPVSEWTKAPEWLYDEPGRARTAGTTRARGSEDAVDDSMAAAIGRDMGSNNDITRWLGLLSAADPSRDYDWFLAELRAAREDGRIVQKNPKWKWEDRDLRTLARTGARFAADDLLERDAWWAEFGITYENVDRVQAAWAAAFAGKASPSTPAPSARAKRRPMTAAALGPKVFDPLHFFVPNTIPEGMTLFSAAPKSGKSLFCYQLGAELSYGGSILGFDVPITPVLYYALEDGERRSQDRIRKALDGRPFPTSLDLYWEGPRLGDGLEEEVGEWLDGHSRGLVIIDVLAKVRPTGPTTRGKNAYDADYEALSELHATAKRRPGSGIIVVTHDRKAGADDWLSKITGTRGTTGVADTALYINRERGKPTGTFHVTGRDVEDESIQAAFHGSGWQRASVLLTLTDTRRTIYEYVEHHGVVSPQQVIEGTGLVPTVVRNRMRDMVADEQLVSARHGMYAIPAERADIEEAG